MCALVTGVQTCALPISPVDRASAEHQPCKKGTDNTDYYIKQNALLSVGPHQNAGQPAENAPNDQPDDEIHRTSPVQVMRNKRSRPENVQEAGSSFETDLLQDQQLANSRGVSKLLFPAFELGSAVCRPTRSQYS